jgi:hypothetical protein
LVFNLGQNFYQHVSVRATLRSKWFEPFHEILKPLTLFVTARKEVGIRVVWVSLEECLLCINKDLEDFIKVVDVYRQYLRRFCLSTL